MSILQNRITKNIALTIKQLIKGFVLNIIKKLMNVSTKTFTRSVMSTKAGFFIEY